jgi:hypothetical protein
VRERDGWRGVHHVSVGLQETASCWYLGGAGSSESDDAAPGTPTDMVAIPKCSLSRGQRGSKIRSPLSLVKSKADARMGFKSFPTKFLVPAGFQPRNQVPSALHAGL